jgi:uncharacterized membrane protein YdjX (TVP38/TMEM64 family)
MRWVLVCVVAAIMIVAWRTGLLGRFTDLARTRATLTELGAWGYVAFIGAYAALQPFGVPGTIFVGVAPLIWPWPIAFALSMAGTMAASVIGFSFARFVARDWIASRVPERFRRYDEALARRAFTTVFLLRLVFWMPQVLHTFFGVSRVTFATHFWGSALGYVIPLFLVSYFGPQIIEWMRNAPPTVWIAILSIVLATGFAWWWSRRAAQPR